MAMTNRSSTSANFGETGLPRSLKHLLPKNYTPNEFDFVIGRGRKVRELPGNQRFYNLVRSVASAYVNGSKDAKSQTLSRVINETYEKSPHAGFIKLDRSSGKWYAVDEAQARTSAAQELRNSSHDFYRSSKQAKQSRRHQAKRTGTATAVASSERKYIETDSTGKPRVKRVYSTPATAVPFTTLTPVSSVNSRDLEETEENCLFLQELLQTVTPVEEDLSMTFFTEKKKDETVFDILARAFAPEEENSQEDPFEPLPIAANMLFF